MRSKLTAKPTIDSEHQRTSANTVKTRPLTSGMVSNYLIVLALYRERSIARLYSLLRCLPPVWSVAATVICGLRDVARCREDGVGGKRGRDEREANASQGDYDKRSQANHKVLIAMKKLVFCASAHCSVSTLTSSAVASPCDPHPFADGKTFLQRETSRRLLKPQKLLLL